MPKLFIGNNYSLKKISGFIYNLNGDKIERQKNRKNKIYRYVFRAISDYYSYNYDYLLFYVPAGTYEYKYSERVSSRL